MLDNYYLLPPSIQAVKENINSGVGEGGGGGGGGQLPPHLDMIAP